MGRISFSDRGEKKTMFLRPTQGEETRVRSLGDVVGFMERASFLLRLREDISSPLTGRRNVSPCREKERGDIAFFINL
ncbi:hypothetical protein BHE74_00025599 [Ensete ventricosum]|nr:hypothetical protein GW17_00031785 [Ensete ventricosum]RWW66987.1 hypothetical protein BHE74_00025599 [Ensete ventricosum]